MNKKRGGSNLISGPLLSPKNLILAPKYCTRLVLFGSTKRNTSEIFSNMTDASRVEIFLLRKLLKSKNLPKKKNFWFPSLNFHHSKATGICNKKNKINQLANQSVNIFKKKFFFKKLINSPGFSCFNSPSPLSFWLSFPKNQNTIKINSDFQLKLQ